MSPHRNEWATRDCTSGTVELQWLEQLWNHEIMFEAGVVLIITPGQEASHTDKFSIVLFNLTVCCVFSFDSPHLGDSNQNYTLYHF